MAYTGKEDEQGQHAEGDELRQDTLACITLSKRLAEIGPIELGENVHCLRQDFDATRSCHGTTVYALTSTSEVAHYFIAVSV